ncbi:MAG: LuxR C-terminal-related transcriptional regulator [Rikenellaceae bacterium]
MAKRVHIVIAEPSSLIRLGLVAMLSKIPSLTVDIAEISDVATIASQSFRLTPDLLIVNPSYLGVFSAHHLKNELGNRNLKVVAIHSLLVDQSLMKNYDEHISIYDSESVIARKITELVDREQEVEIKKELSQREKEIIVGVVKGNTNKEIADELCISTHTVIAHRRNITSKLKIHSPSGLTIYAIVNKLVNIEDIQK